MAYVVIARWTAKSGEEEAVASAISRLIGPSREEPGNLLYEPHRDPENPRAFLLYERYVNADAYKVHGESPHFQEHAIADAIPRLESREREFLVTWGEET